jgi:hypothetical protein
VADVESEPETGPRRDIMIATGEVVEKIRTVDGGTPGPLSEISRI